MNKPEIAPESVREICMSPEGICQALPEPRFCKSWGLLELQPYLISMTHRNRLSLASFASKGFWRTSTSGARLSKWLGVALYPATRKSGEVGPDAQTMMSR